MANIKRKFGTILTILIVGVFVYYFAQNRDALGGLLEAPIIALIIIALLKIAKIFNSAQYNIISLESYKIRLPLAESFYISTLTTIGNYFGPALGGAGIRAVYLKKKYKFAYTDFISTLSGFYLISFLIGSVLGLISLLGLYLERGAYLTPLFLFFIFWFAFNLGMSLLPKSVLLKLIPAKGRLLTNLRATVSRVLDGWEVIKQDKRLLLRLLGVIFGSLSISILTSLAEFWALGIPLSWSILVLYSVISSLSLLVSITPGAIGIREAMYFFTSSILFLSNEQILQLAVIDRGVNYIVLFILFFMSRKFFSSEVVRSPTSQTPAIPQE